MPWCPKCKNEYREGITICADCGVELVDSLSENDVSLTFGEQDQMARLVAFLSYNHVENAYMKEDEAEHVFEVFVSQDSFDQAKKIAAIFMLEENQKNEACASTDAAAEDAEESIEKAQKSGVYVNNEQKANEFKSSGYTLLVVGIIGLAAEVCVYFNVFSIPIFGKNNYIAYGVLGCMFLLFLILGIRSLSSSKIYSGKISEENHLKDEIMQWAKDAFQKDEIDAACSLDDLAEEEKYFKRFELMKKRTSEKFLNLDQAFLESLIDELYPQIFEE